MTVSERRFLLALLLSLLPTGAGAALPPSPNPQEICRLTAYRIEREENLPGQVLAAIAMVESGRWDRDAKANSAWPWTVNAEGRGRFLPSKAAAIAEVEALKARGVRNIDVGCMQVNLLHHPDAFDSLEEAFDPEVNIRYAAGFLKRLFETHRSWHAAIARYHSATEELHVPYRRKVLASWNEERKTAAEVMRAEKLAAWEERRQQLAQQAAAQQELQQQRAQQQLLQQQRGAAQPGGRAPAVQGGDGPRGRTLQDYRNHPVQRQGKVLPRYSQAAGPFRPI